MTGLPLLFIGVVSGSNPTFFDPMLKTPIGHKAIILCVILWVLGAVTVLKISKFDDV
jgi:Flp pilus assembly protein TadB